MKKKQSYRRKSSQIQETNFTKIYTPNIGMTAHFSGLVQPLQ